MTFSSFQVSNIRQEHFRHVEEVLKRLSQQGLTIKPNKCKYGAEEVTLLGTKVNSCGISPLLEKVKAIENISKPRTIQELQRFLGMVNFCRRWVAKAANIILPLTNALANNKSKLQKIKWDDQMRGAFDTIKRELAVSTLLVFPDPDAKLVLKVDVSDKAMGGVLQ
ncbi:hypothetical protein GWI33_009178 [Rhynchophorus ferrugineus]|uniref:RNA-directed DNA polymerase n=1 Tax=Rhynchophorus ferrugineus TaxID=354439 RepID=A0A834MDL4_RHYFE|nr:hypothetical protein GWI33_009178 [Rhynchophorus ferrugineus]